MIHRTAAAVNAPPTPPLVPTTTPPDPARPFAHLVSITKATKIVGRSRYFIRTLIDTGELTALRNGGSDHRPILLVDPAELTAAIVRTQKYVAPAGTPHSHAPAGYINQIRRRGRRPQFIGRVGPMHPAASAL